ncbi:peptidase S49 [Ventosimonas gracilis]|uniref:Peptidase S49 n=1 Tax=Ventosimonas gracilis TaxID=1680762 RepID=A0A139SV90_9GAMM|nr:S49 family peptidase [Ventosimonas gracilis]KXU38528.1 peptidase S49 [Ventosimonas gracilis]
MEGGKEAWKEVKEVKDSNDKSWQLLEKVLLAGVQEQKRSRRWGIFFKSLTFIYLIGVLLVFSPQMNLPSGAGGKGGAHTAVIELKGMIDSSEQASADNIVGSLRNAFADKNTKGIVLRINSPGGSPVQSGYIYDEIRRLRGEHPDTKLYAVITDLGASGAYYIASAADAIYADKASLVGSIGVTAAGFGFVGGMEKLGIERRTYTSGEHKAFLDAFSPQREDETRFWQQVLGTVHQQFIDSVKAGRGERLKADEHPELFSGLIWSGEQALELGLIDGLGSTSFVAREVIKEENIQDFTRQPSPLERLSRGLGTSVAERLALWMGFSAPALR